MRLIAILRMRLLSLFSRSAVDDELDAEFRYHLDRQIEENLAAGMTPEDARLAALRDFQNFDQRKEQCRDTRGWNLMDTLIQDLRFTFRQLLKNAGFTSTAILMLALGICASVAIFAFVDAALIQPLPYRDPSRLVAVYGSVPQCPLCNLSYLDYLDWKRLNKVFTSLEVYIDINFIVRAPAGAEPAPAARVSAGFFRTLGVHPSLGRDFHDGEDLAGAARTVLLSDAAWKKRYGAKPDAVGRTVTLDGSVYLIIGVLPQDFHFAPVGPAEFWATVDPSAYCEQRRSCHDLSGVARLAGGTSVDKALAGLTVITQQLERQYPDSNSGQGVSVTSLTEAIVGQIQPILLVLLAGAGLLLVIACVNVSSLLLVRSESRRRELAVRTALGASRLRLVRQFVTEASILAAVGTGLGLACALWTIQLLTRLIPVNLLASLPFLHSLALNTRAVLFACAIALLAATVFSIMPLVCHSMADLHGGLTEASRGSAGNTWRRVGSKLVVVELATAVILLVGAGLLGQSLLRLLNVDIGFKPDRLTTMPVQAPNARYGRTPQAIALGREIVSRIANLPGVVSAATASVLPVNYNGNTEWIRFVGRPYHGEHNEVLQRRVSSGYFTTIGAKLLRGRYFTDREDTSQPRAVIINQALAKKYFAGEDPLGKQIADYQLSPTSFQQIVGIVDDIREGPLDSEIRPAMYVPFNQAPGNYLTLIVRTSQDDPSLPLALAATIRQIDSGIVTRAGRTMRERIQDSPSAYLHRSSALLVGGFAGMALLLGVIGLYGVVAYSVSQRTREIGVRMALGAEPATVYKLILTEAARLTATGVLAGILCSLASSALMRKLLFGISSRDLPTLIAVAAVLGVFALLASFLPARRAATVNPVDALRAE